MHLRSLNSGKWNFYITKNILSTCVNVDVICIFKQIVASLTIYIISNEVISNQRELFLGLRFVQYCFVEGTIIIAIWF